MQKLASQVSGVTTAFFTLHWHKLWSIIDSIVKSSCKPVHCTTGNMHTCDNSNTGCVYKSIACDDYNACTKVWLCSTLKVVYWLFQRTCWHLKSTSAALKNCGIPLKGQHLQLSPTYFFHLSSLLLSLLLSLLTLLLLFLSSLNIKKYSSCRMTATLKWGAFTRTSHLSVTTSTCVLTVILFTIVVTTITIHIIFQYVYFCTLLIEDYLDLCDSAVGCIHESILLASCSARYINFLFDFKRHKLFFKFFGLFGR